METGYTVLHDTFTKAINIVTTLPFHARIPNTPVPVCSPFAPVICYNKTKCSTNSDPAR